MHVLNFVLGTGLELAYTSAGIAGTEREREMTCTQNMVLQPELSVHIHIDHPTISFYAL
jgi:hypothetical protein